MRTLIAFQELEITIDDLKVCCQCEHFIGVNECWPTVGTDGKTRVAPKIRINCNKLCSHLPVDIKQASCDKLPDVDIAAEQPEKPEMPENIVLKDAEEPPKEEPKIMTTETVASMVPGARRK